MLPNSGKWFGLELEPAHVSLPNYFHLIPKPNSRPQELIFREVTILPLTKSLDLGLNLGKFRQHLPCIRVQPTYAGEPMLQF